MSQQFSSAFYVAGILLSAGIFKLLLIMLYGDISHHLEPVLCTWHGLCPLRLKKLPLITAL